MLCVNDYTILKNYFKQRFYKNIKFVSDEMIHQSNELMDNCYREIMKSRTTHPELYTPIARLMKNSLTQKQGYTTEAVRKHLQGEFIVSGNNGTLTNKNI